MEIKAIREVLQRTAINLQDAIKDGILNQGLLKTGKLANSVQVTYRDEPKQPQFDITMEDYGYYQDSGVSGTKIKITNNPALSLFAPGEFKKKTIGGNLPFPVRKSIAEKGFRPRPFIIPSVENYVDFITPELEDAGVEDIQEFVTEQITLNGGQVS
jgi:hypothetical protein